MICQILIFSEQEAAELAQFFLDKSTDNPTDYLSKYKAAATAEESPEPAPGEAMQPEPKSDVIVCPKCGAPMIKRKATKGENAGNEFYGCSRFPHCRGIVNIEN